MLLARWFPAMMNKKAFENGLDMELHALKRLRTLVALQLARLKHEEALLESIKESHNSLYNIDDSDSALEEYCREDDDHDHNDDDSIDTDNELDGSLTGSQEQCQDHIPAVSKEQARLGKRKAMDSQHERGGAVDELNASNAENEREKIMKGG